MPDRRPYEVTPEYLVDHLEEMVLATFGDLESQFLVLPKGPNFVEYNQFQEAYEVLKRATSSFTNLNHESLWEALRFNALCFIVLRTMLGMTPPEWAEIARTEAASDVTQGAARALDQSARRSADYFARISRRNDVTLNRVNALLTVAVDALTMGAPAGAANTVHRLAKVDSSAGLESLQYVAAQHVPYAVVLYERFLGRPFASHRDAVSELIGDVMETAIEERLSRSQISFRRTGRAERIPGWEQAPDFFVPDEINPAAVIEAKITSDDGTARDKVARILRLAEIRDRRLREGSAGFQVIACLDGRGFGVRREDMRQVLRRTEGKVFTLRTLDQLVAHTRISPVRLENIVRNSMPLWNWWLGSSGSRSGAGRCVHWPLDCVKRPFHCYLGGRRRLRGRM